LLVAQIGILRDAVRQVRVRAPFRVDAWVVLPDHMHCLWTLPEDDGDFPGRWRWIKTAFVKCLPAGERLERRQGEPQAAGERRRDRNRPTDY
jgi:putative transposase